MENNRTSLINYDGQWNPSVIHPFSAILQSFAQDHSVSVEDAETTDSCFRFRFALPPGIGLDVSLYHVGSERVFVFLKAFIGRLPSSESIDIYKHVCERTSSFSEAYRLTIQEGSVVLVARLRAEAITCTYFQYLLGRLIPTAKEELNILKRQFGLRTFYGEME